MARPLQVESGQSPETTAENPPLVSDGGMMMQVK